MTRRAFTQVRSKADIARCQVDVRFTPKSGHCLRRPACPLTANSGNRDTSDDSNRVLDQEYCLTHTRQRWFPKGIKRERGACATRCAQCPAAPATVSGESPADFATESD